MTEEDKKVKEEKNNLKTDRMYMPRLTTNDC